MEPDFTFALSFAFTVTLVQLAALRLIDLNEKEPLWALLLLIWLGAVSAAGAALVVDPEIIDPSGFEISLASEIAKFAAIAAGFAILHGIDRRRGWAELNGLVDCLIYGSAAGLGFATADGLLRETFASARELQTPDQETFWHLLWTTLQSSLAQGFFGAVIGAGMGLFLFGRGRAIRLVAPLAGLAAAIAGHWLYGWVALDDFQVGPELTPESGIAVGLLAAGAVVVFVGRLRGETSAIVEELEKESVRDAEVVTRGELRLFKHRRERHRNHLGKFLSGELEELARLRAIRDRQVQLALARRRLWEHPSAAARTELCGQVEKLRDAIRRQRAGGRLGARSWRTRLTVGTLGLVLLALGSVLITVAGGREPPTALATRSALFERAQQELSEHYERPIRRDLLNLVGPWRLERVRESELAAEGAREAYEVGYAGEGSVRYTIAAYDSIDKAEAALDVLDADTGGRMDSLGWVSAEHGYLTTLLEGEAASIVAFCDDLPSDRRPPDRMTAFKAAVAGSLDDTEWEDRATRDNPVLFVRTDGRASILASQEPLTTPMTSQRYARFAGQGLEAFDRYEEISLDPIDLRSAAGGYQRVYEWTDDDRRRLRQIQVYISECGRGYLFTATALKEDFAEFEALFDRVFDSL